MVEAGVLATVQAERLAPSAGLRNVLVHHYVDVRIDVVAAAIGEALEQYPAYVVAVSRYLDAHAASS